MPLEHISLHACSNMAIRSPRLLPRAIYAVRFDLMPFAPSISAALAAPGDGIVYILNSLGIGWYADLEKSLPPNLSGYHRRRGAGACREVDDRLDERPLRTTEKPFIAPQTVADCSRKFGSVSDWWLRSSLWMVLNWISLAFLIFAVTCDHPGESCDGVHRAGWALEIFTRSVRNIVLVGLLSVGHAYLPVFTFGNRPLLLGAPAYTCTDPYVIVRGSRRSHAPEYSVAQAITTI